MVVRFLELTLTLCTHPQGFITSLLLLIDKSVDLALLEEITTLLGTWIQAPVAAAATAPTTAAAAPSQPQPFLSAKEKTNFLIHMTRYEQFWGREKVCMRPHPHAEAYAYTLTRSRKYTDKQPQALST